MNAKKNKDIFQRQNGGRKRHQISPGVASLWKNAVLFVWGEENCLPNMEALALFGLVTLVDVFQWLLGKAFEARLRPRRLSGSPFWKNKFGSFSGLVAPFGARVVKRTTIVPFDAIAGLGCDDRRQFVLSRWRAVWVKSRRRSGESTPRSKNN